MYVVGPENGSIHYCMARNSCHYCYMGAQGCKARIGEIHVGGEGRGEGFSLQVFPAVRSDEIR